MNFLTDVFFAAKKMNTVASFVADELSCVWGDPELKTQICVFWQKGSLLASLLYLEVRMKVSPQIHDFFKMECNDGISIEFHPLSEVSL